MNARSLEKDGKGWVSLSALGDDMGMKGKGMSIGQAHHFIERKRPIPDSSWTPFERAQGRKRRTKGVKDLVAKNEGKKKRKGKGSAERKISEKKMNY